MSTSVADEELRPREIVPHLMHGGAVARLRLVSRGLAQSRPNPPDPVHNSTDDVGKLQNV